MPSLTTSLPYNPGRQLALELASCGKASVTVGPARGSRQEKPPSVHLVPRTPSCGLGTLLSSAKTEPGGAIETAWFVERDE